MAGAGQHRAVGAESLNEHVADGVEGLIVRTADDELGERPRRELLERRLGLRRGALDPQGARPLEEPRREVAGRDGRTDSLQEVAQETLVIARAVLPELDGACGEGSGGRIVPRDPERGRLDHRQREQPVGVTEGGEKRDHAAVRVSDEVRPRLDELLEPDGLVLEVDPLDIRPRREPAPVRDDELEALGERPLCRPGCITVDDAAVDEEDAGTVDPGILWTGTK